MCARSRQRAMHRVMNIPFLRGVTSDVWQNAVYPQPIYTEDSSLAARDLMNTPRKVFLITTDLNERATSSFKKETYLELIIENRLRTVLKLNKNKIENCRY